TTRGLAVPAGRVAAGASARRLAGRSAMCAPDDAGNGSVVRRSEMKRLLWPLGLVVAFGLGLLVSVLPRPDRGTAPEVERLQMQVSTLQARLRAREANV